MTDRGLWVSWYNLPAAGRDAYLSWLHGTYIPRILKKTGVLWAAHYKSDQVPPAPIIRHTDDPSVPAGADYVLLFGGDTKVEDEMLAWYADWRFGALGKLPGCVRIREMVSVSGWPKHGVIYEFLSRQARDANLPNLRKMYPGEGAWSDRFVPTLIHTPESPVVGSRLWPPVK